MNKHQAMKIESLAIIVTVISGLFTVIYSDGYFSAWDLMVGVFVAYICIAYKSDLSTSPTDFMISRIGLSIASTIILMSIITAISIKTAKAIQSFSYNIIDGVFLIVLAAFFLTFLLYRKDKSTENSNT